MTLVQSEKGSKRAFRRDKTKRHITKQKRILKQSGINHRFENQDNRYAKTNALDCGQSDCLLCGNPRRQGHKTIQEKKFLEAAKEQHVSIRNR